MTKETAVFYNKRWRTPAALLAAVVLSASLSLPAWADTTQKVVLTVQKGSSSAVVNGKSYTIAKPVSRNGIVMVPLSIFKKAFGSEIRLEGTSRVRLLQGPHAVVMIMGSTTAWIDGKKVKLPAEPQMVSGTLMVPLRPVAAGIGAKLSTDKDGKLSISLKVTDKSGSGNSTDPDGMSGKSRVGNSYYQWSINYPAGMVIGSGSDSENVASFTDATGRYYLEVHADPQSVELDTEDLLQQLIKDARLTGDVVLDQETVAQAPVPYARIVSRDADGVLWEGRLYYANKRLYGLYFADSDAIHYKDLDKYADLLNSFKVSFNAGDKNLKDLSSMENGLRSITNADYGITAAVPAGWQVNNQEMFYGSEEEGYLSIYVNSAPKGVEGTLSGWADRMKKWLEESFAADAYQIVGLTPVEISGVKGQILEVRYNFGDGWTTEYEVMVQKNGYRYYLEYTVPEGKEEAARAWKNVLKSIHIDYEAVPANFGRIGDADFLTDKTKMATKTSNVYKYHVDIPRYWTPISDRFDSGRVEYGFVGGSFAVESVKDTPAEYIVSRLKQYYNEAASGKSKLKVLGIEDTTFAGVSAVSFRVHQVKNGIGYTTRQIVFEKDGATHTVTAVLNDANATDVQKQAIERTLASFQTVE
ncbi:stalk domain-containing protein [Paenibacillus sp. DMB20]|uniref:stalk domain-containing protein n=1 Tax=Paenibacillus sp. DMB20 TaxID=1642570 RepID=UPI000627BC23|nr:stalk domain-containing protein [Paenibacillus sp. DMB20]KKO55019.1 copper amine oxidase [Paenibacillus sp. DMB20]